MLDARDPVDAIRLKATRLAVIRRGKVIAESAPRQSRLMLDGRPESVAAAAAKADPRFRANSASLDAITA